MTALQRGLSQGQPLAHGSCFKLSLSQLPPKLQLLVHCSLCEVRGLWLAGCLPSFTQTCPVTMDLPLPLDCAWPVHWHRAWSWPWLAGWCSQLDLRPASSQWMCLTLTWTWLPSFPWQLLGVGVLGAAQAPLGWQERTSPAGSRARWDAAGDSSNHGHLPGDCGLGWGQCQVHGRAGQDCSAVGLQLRQGPNMRASGGSSSRRQGLALTAASLQHSTVEELPPMASSRMRTTLGCTGSELSNPPPAPRRGDALRALTAAYSELWT